jgi:hypothetical protein
VKLGEKKKERKRERENERERERERAPPVDVVYLCAYMNLLSKKTS